MRRYIYFIPVLIIAVYGCEKIVAEDITNETPVLILPAANDTINLNPVHFKWKATEGATKYHLEIVSPGFANISSYALDSVIAGTDFFVSLDSNEYELRLTALNGGYESKTLGPVKFWVGVQPSQTSSNVVLNAPADLEYVNGSFNNSFTWQSLSGATSYEISVRQGITFETGTVIGSQNNIVTTNYTEPATLTEGTYTWGVKAYLSGSETPYSVRTLYVDETSPNTAILSIPTDFSFLTQGVITFSWSNGTDPGTVNSPVNSLLEIASDSGFTNVVHSSAMVGSTEDVNLTPGTYYWRVTNTDDAGNTAGASNTFQLTVN